MDREDRDIVGQAINLSDSQILDIAELKTGKAIVHNREVHQAFMVHIDESPIQTIDDRTLSEFYIEFLDKHKKYQYRYLQESRFFLQDSQMIVQHIRSINTQKRKRFLLELFNAVLLGKDRVNIEESFAKFWNLYHAHEDDKERERKIACYLFVETFKDLSFLGNAQYYKNIHAYQRVIEYMLDLIEILCNKDATEMIECQKDIQEVFSHKNIAPIFPSMQGYGNKTLDYTLLILENILTNEEIKMEFSRIIHVQNVNVPKEYKNILKKYMGMQYASQQLLTCTAAVRSGMQEINLNSRRK